MVMGARHQDRLADCPSVVTNYNFSFNFNTNSLCGCAVVVMSVVKASTNHRTAD
jgi:hypothetical protein